MKVVSSAFIVGSSGYTGQHLVQTGPKLGCSVVAHVRPRSSKEEAMRTLCADNGACLELVPFEKDAFAAALERHAPTFVFACLGTTRRRAAEEAEANYESVDYGLTKFVMDACSAMAQPPRFVYLSALGGGRPSTNAYMSVRYRVETELRASPLSWTIARPAFISGPDRGESRPMERFGAAAGDGVLRALGFLGAKRLERKYASLSGAALAEGMLRAALQDHERGTSTVWEADTLRAASFG
ncbi:MAG: nucleoside-diphosphate-sugar epimerase [Polyangiales bacterium]|jgi:nucleoside-diphosphate-sugar epimerase